MNKEPRTLTKRVAELLLSEDDDLEALFPAKYERIVIWADTVRIEGHVHLPGRKIEIRARTIDPRPGRDGPATLDVSGGPAEPDFDPVAPSPPELKGSRTAPDGRTGQAGGAGRSAGQVSIVVDKVEAALTITANGSRGGNSQRGGDGGQPAQVNGADGAFLKAKWPERGKFGGGVLQAAGIGNRYVSWAAGDRGGDSRQGGAAGAPGQPGAGGPGGEISAVYTGPSEPALKMSVTGGNAGLPGLPANPGAASTLGIGGRNRIYAYDITATREEFARSGRDPVIDEFANLYKIPARAPNGNPGAPPGKVPPQPKAEPGQAGRTTVGRVTYDKVSPAFDLGFLQLLLKRADRDRSAGENERALLRYEWIVHLTESRAQGDEDLARVLRAAQDGLAHLQSG